MDNKEQWKMDMERRKVETCVKLECIMGRVLYREFKKLVSEEMDMKEVDKWDDSHPTDCDQYVEFNLKFAWKFAKRCLLATWEHNFGNSWWWEDRFAFSEWKIQRFLGIWWKEYTYLYDEDEEYENAITEE